MKKIRLIFLFILFILPYSVIGATRIQDDTNLIVTKQFNFSPFNKVEIDIPANVDIHDRSPSFSMTASGSKMMMDKMLIKVSNHTLYVTTGLHSHHFAADNVMHLSINVAQIQEIKASSYAKINLANANSHLYRIIMTDNVSMNIDGYGIGLREIFDSSSANLSIRHINTDSLYVKKSSKGVLQLLGHICLRRFDYTGSGNVTMDYLKKNPLIINFQGSGDVKLHGDIALQALNFWGSGRLTMYWVNSDRLKILANGNGLIELAGIATLLDAELSHDMYLETRFLRAQTVAIKTYDHARADVYPLLEMYSYANNSSNIYYFNQPLFFYAREMRQSGSILSMHDIPGAYTHFWEDGMS